MCDSVDEAVLSGDVRVTPQQQLHGACSSNVDAPEPFKPCIRFVLLHIQPPVGVLGPQSGAAVRSVSAPTERSQRAPRHRMAPWTRPNAFTCYQWPIRSADTIRMSVRALRCQIHCAVDMRIPTGHKLRCAARTNYFLLRQVPPPILKGPSRCAHQVLASAEAAKYRCRGGGQNGPVGHGIPSTLVSVESTGPTTPTTFLPASWRA